MQKTALRKIQAKSDLDLLRANLRFGTYFLNLTNPLIYGESKGELTQKEKEEWKTIRAELRKRKLLSPKEKKS